MSKLPARRRRFLAWLGVVGALLVTAPLSSCAHGSSAERAVPSVYTSLSLPDALDRPFSAPALRGRPVLVSFTSTWCFPCLNDLRVWQALHDEFADQGLVVLLVGMDLEGSKVLAPFTEHYAFPFPVLVADQRVRTGESFFGPIRSLPTTVLLDRDGTPVLAFQQAASLEPLRRAVRGLLPR